MSRAADIFARAGAIVIFLGLVACAGGRRYGDARLIEGTNPSFLPETVGSLTFPEIPIGRVSVVRYHVASLPRVIYPSGFLLEVPKTEDFPRAAEHPWSHCVIHASLLAADGTRFFSREIHLGRDRQGSDAQGSRRKISFAFTDYRMEGTTSLPRHVTYDFEVEVLRASSRPTDKLVVEAYSVLPSTKAPVRP